MIIVLPYPDDMAGRSHFYNFKFQYACFFRVHGSKSTKKAAPYDFVQVTDFLIFASRIIITNITMKKSFQLWMTVVLMAVFGMANASTAQWYGYALYTSNGANWQNHFVSFNAQSPDAVQAVSETLPAIWAATYVDG